MCAEDFQGGACAGCGFCDGMDGTDGEGGMDEGGMDAEMQMMMQCNEVLSSDHCQQCGAMCMQCRAARSCTWTASPRR